MLSNRWGSAAACPASHAPQARASRVLCCLLFCLPLLAQKHDLVPVTSQTSAARTLAIPGEILPYQRTTLQARVRGYIERVTVDRGSTVRAGQLLISITAPELAAQVAEAEARVQALEADRAVAQARVAAAQATYERLKTASATPGAIAGNELIQADKAVEAEQARVRAAASAIESARAAVSAVKQSEQYRGITAPFSGVITERHVHPGALASPELPLLELEQVSRLRVVVPVPETEVASIRRGTRVSFKVPAYPGRTYQGTVARIDRSLDAKTRTMPVELDVNNPRLELAPGMYPEVSWPAGGIGTALLVPPTAVVTTTERSFVIRARDGKAEWVDVRKGRPNGDLLEVRGDLSPGDQVVKRGTDEIRPGQKL